MNYNYEKVKLTEAERQEVEKNGKGKILAVIGIAIIFLAAFTNGGGGAIFLGIIGTAALVLGFFMAMSNRSEDGIRTAKARAEAAVMLHVAMAKTGKTEEELGITSAARKEQQKKETKEIVKGAIVGGIVAGEAGAVVGAVAAKNKIDNKKSQK